MRPAGGFRLSCVRVSVLVASLVSVVVLFGPGLAASGQASNVSTDPAASGVAPTIADDGHPTVRLFATREGLVGRKTANGHIVVDHDRFVALPSKRVLNPLDGRDFQVRLSYKGRTAVAPVWDVGPWNT